MSGRPPDVGMSRKPAMQPNVRSKSEALLLLIHGIKEQVEAFQGIAREIMPPLGKGISPAENAAMETPRANIVGSLENLLNQEFPDVLRQLDELKGYLQAMGIAAPEVEAGMGTRNPG